MKYKSPGHFSYEEIENMLRIARSRKMIMLFTTETDDRGDPVAVCELVKPLSDVLTSAIIRSTLNQN